MESRAQERFPRTRVRLDRIPRAADSQPVPADGHAPTSERDGGGAEPIANGRSAASKRQNPLTVADFPYSQYTAPQPRMIIPKRYTGLFENGTDVCWSIIIHTRGTER